MFEVRFFDKLLLSALQIKPMTIIKGILFSFSLGYGTVLDTLFSYYSTNPNSATFNFADY